MAKMTIMTIPALEKEKKDDDESLLCEKGLKALWDANLIKAVPNRFIFPSPERPKHHHTTNNGKTNGHFKLPVIHFDQLRGPNRTHVLRSLADACQNYGFFQLVNHGIAEDVINDMRDVTRRFFDLPVTEREVYMSADVSAPVRYGTSFNQTKDGVFCWRDFLKLVCDPNVLSHWPSNSPLDFRKCAVKYAENTKALFLKVAEAVVESLGAVQDGGDQEVVNDENIMTSDEKIEEKIITEVKNGSQFMMLNYYPQCPNPDLTLGIPPHSDFDFLTLLLQDDVNGLQIHHRGDWVGVDVIPNAFVVNVGDLLEIFSNGKYKSVMHRAVVNSFKPRISVASFHSTPIDTIVEPSPKLISSSNPRWYKGTNFSTFLEYIKTSDYKKKNFLESRKLFN